MPIPRKKAPVKKVVEATPETESEDKVPARIAEYVAPVAEAVVEKTMPGFDELIDTPNLSAEALETKKILAKRPKMVFIIPVQPGNTNSFETVQINGYKITMKRGTALLLPDRVVELLATLYQVDIDAGVNKMLGKDEKVSNALS